MIEIINLWLKMYEVTSFLLNQNKHTKNHFGIFLNIQAQMPDNILQIDLLQTAV